MLEEKGIIYFNKYKNKNSNEIVNKQDNIYLNDIYFSIKNTNNTNVSIKTNFTIAFVFVRMKKVKKV